nr:MAG TPA: Peptidoglycan endopeptidase [Caudoviricetes sp.]
MRRKEKLTRLLKSALLLLAFCLSAMTLIIGGTASAAPQQVTMSLEQWNQLKQNTAQLEANLNLVAEKLKQQKSTSKELLTQLDEAKKQLKLTQEALTNSQRSLTNAKESLKRSEDLYETLIEQMEYDRKRTNRIKHQRNLYAGCAVFVLAYAVAK